MDLCNEEGDTALHLACASAFANCADLLLPSDEVNIDYSTVDVHEYKVSNFQ